MSDHDAKGKIDDGSVCPESMNGEHCGHYYYDWAPDVPGEPHPGHNGPHCCYCDKDREYRYKTPEWLTARLAELESVPVLETPPPRIEMSSEQRGERPCRCGHAMSFHRHDDDLLQMECGANPDCGHFSCRFPWTPTDFAPRPECDCKNWGAPVEPVPAHDVEPKTIVRPDDDGTPDDIVIDDVKLFQMERMDDNAWWIGLYFEDTTNGAPDRICFWVGAKRAKVDVSVTEVSDARQITDDTSVLSPPVGTQE